MSGNTEATLSGGEQQFEFGVGETIAENDCGEKLDDTTICEVKQRFIDVDSKTRYYKVEVLNLYRYLEHYWIAEKVESDFETKETWSSDEINEWESNDWGTCPVFSVNHRPEREPVMKGGGGDGN